MMLTGGLLAIVALLIAPFQPWRISNPLSPSPRLDEQRAHDVFETLQRNAYRAFDYREENEIYDALARSVDGPLLTDLYLRYDLIILDSPPTLSTGDSRLVASQADAAVVVYDPSQSRVDGLQRTIDLLESARANIVGLVANRSRVADPVYMSASER